VIFNFFKPSPVLDEESIQWLFDLYAWALQNFDAQLFFEQSILVIPSNQYFPGTASSPEEMAQIIFDKVREYAGLKHWPCRLSTDQNCLTQQPARLTVPGALRTMNGEIADNLATGETLAILYDPRQVTNPEAIIASFSHTLAHHLGSMAQSLPPGGEDNWPHVTEVLAVFMGFGLMFANSAFEYRNITCGSCQPVKIQRQSFLSQYDITYALAMFAVLKGIPYKEVNKNIKKSLRSYFKNAYKDVQKRSVELERLRFFYSDKKAVEAGI